MELKFSTWLECGTPLLVWALGWVRPGTSSVLQRLKQSKPKFLEFCNSQQMTTTYVVVVVGIVGFGSPFQE
jgi:hypothetical protein